MKIAPKKCLTQLLKPKETEDFSCFFLLLLVLLLLLLLLLLQLLLLLLTRHLCTNTQPNNNPILLHYAESGCNRS